MKESKIHWTPKMTDMALEASSMTLGVMGTVLEMSGFGAPIGIALNVASAGIATAATSYELKTGQITQKQATEQFALDAIMLGGSVAVAVKSAAYSAKAVDAEQLSDKIAINAKQLSEASEKIAINTGVKKVINEGVMKFSEKTTVSKPYQTGTRIISGTQIITTKEVDDGNIVTKLHDSKPGEYYDKILEEQRLKNGRGTNFDFVNTEDEIKNEPSFSEEEKASFTRSFGKYAGDRIESLYELARQHKSDAVIYRRNRYIASGISLVAKVGIQSSISFALSNKL